MMIMSKIEWDIFKKSEKYIFNIVTSLSQHSDKKMSYFHNVGYIYWIRKT